jgi:hypothetical protein
MKITRNQWRVRVGSKDMVMFTSKEVTNRDVVMAHIRQRLTNQQAHIADPKSCAECGEYNGVHEEGCSAQ